MLGIPSTKKTIPLQIYWRTVHSLRVDDENMLFKLLFIKSKFLDFFKSTFYQNSCMFQFKKYIQVCYVDITIFIRYIGCQHMMQMKTLFLSQLFILFFVDMVLKLPSNLGISFELRQPNWGPWLALTGSGTHSIENCFNSGIFNFKLAVFRFQRSNGFECHLEFVTSAEI